jgi:hypothetical protein
MAVAGYELCLVIGRAQLKRTRREDSPNGDRRFHRNFVLLPAWRRKLISGAADYDAVVLVGPTSINAATCQLDV